MRKRLWLLAALPLLVAAKLLLEDRSPSVRAMPAAPQPANDAYGDPLPAFATARIGSLRFRGAAYGLGWADGGAGLVSCGADGVVRVFDAETGLVRREFVAHRGMVAPGGGARSVPDAVGGMFTGRSFRAVHDRPSAAAVSRDGRRIVTAGAEAVSVWDAASGEKLSTWRARTDAANVLAISDDGRVVAQGGSDGRLEVRDADSGRRAARLRERSGRPVSDLSLSADGALAAFVESASGTTIHLLEVATGREIGDAGAESEGGAVAISPRGDVVVTSPRRSNVVEGAPDHAVVGGRFVSAIEARDTAGFGAVAASEPFRDDPWAPFAFRADGRLVASGGRALTLLDPATGRIVRSMPGGPGDAEIGTIAWSPDGRRVAALCRGAIRVWDAETGAELHPTTPVGVLADVSDDGRVVAVGRVPSVVDLFDARTGALVRTVGAPSGAEWAPASATLAGGLVTAWTYANGAVRVRAWRAGDGSEAGSADIPDVGQVTWLPSSPVITRGRPDGPVELLDPTNGRVAATVPSPVQARLTPDRRHVVCVGETVRILDVATGADLLATGVPSTVWCAPVFSPDSQSMALADGGRVHVLDVATGRKIADFDAPESDYANPIALSPGARLAATAGADGAIVLRDVATGDVVATLPGHRSRVSRLVFSADGRTLASSAETILVWDVSGFANGR